MRDKTDNPKAAAEYYRQQRLSGTWDPDKGESLMMTMTTPEKLDELLDLVRQIDRDLSTGSASDDR
jgi:hypothetical protein